jgi:hypothetical protein
VVGIVASGLQGIPWNRIWSPCNKALIVPGPEAYAILLAGLDFVGAIIRAVVEETRGRANDLLSRQPAHLSLPKSA